MAVTAPNPVTVVSFSNDNLVPDNSFILKLPPIPATAPAETFNTDSLFEKLHVNAEVAGALVQTFVFSEIIPLLLELKRIVLSSVQGGMVPVVLKSTRIFPLASPIPPLSYLQSPFVSCWVLSAEEFESLFFLQERTEKQSAVIKRVYFTRKAFMKEFNPR
jgi:hypothetical protein